MTDTQTSDAKRARAAISPKLRFEIFKRDKFTCQYCGHGAPEVVLHCDHIVAVANGGSSDILNLITSCSTCNGGKGATPLSDSVVIDKQRKMLEELEDRRQQLEMLSQWRDELQSLQGSEVDAVARRMAQKCGANPYYPNETGRAAIKRWLRKYTVSEVLIAVDESFDIYLEFKDGKVTSDSWETAFSKVSTMASIAQSEADHPNLRRLLYIQGILRNKLRMRHLNCVDYLEHLVSAGADLDELERRAKRDGGNTDFRDFYDGWLRTIGRPF